jgi:nucleoid DNA-binding protein
VVTTSFLEELQNALVNEGDVYLPGIGRLHVSEYKGNTANLESTGGKRTVVNPTHLRVFFRKAPALRDALKRRKK